MRNKFILSLGLLSILAVGGFLLNSTSTPTPNTQNATSLSVDRSYDDYSKDDRFGTLVNDTVNLESSTPYSVLPETPRYSDWRNYNPETVLVSLDGAMVRFNRVSFTTKGDNTIWVGRRDGNALSFYVASSSQNLYFAAVEDGQGTSYSVEVNNKTGRVISTYDDRSNHCAGEIEASNLSAPSQTVSTITSAESSNSTATTVIDLALFVDEATLKKENNDFEVLYTKMVANLESSNQELVNSKITNFKWNLASLNVVPASLFTASTNLSVSLGQIYSSGTQGSINSYTEAIRSKVGADQVHLLITAPGVTAGGVGYIGLPYGVTLYDQLFYRTMTHEMGHNLGGYHDRITSNTVGTDQGNYFYGFMAKDQAFFYSTAGGNYTGDIMSYAPHRLPMFANPDNVYTYSSKGTYNGKAYDYTTTFNVGVPAGQPDAANCSKTISDGAASIASLKALSSTPYLVMDLTDVSFVDGTNEVLAVAGSSSATYQWFRNGVAISGATNSSLSVTAKSSDYYYCNVTMGTTTIQSHILSSSPFVVPTINKNAKAINISTRAMVRGGAENLIAGFVITGTSKKTVLIRAGGPALIPLGLTGALADPFIKLYDSTQTVIASNDNWDYSKVNSVANSVGAYSFAAGSKDAAILITLDPGLYTAEVSSAVEGQTGIALVEVYEIDKTNTDSHLSNISSRSKVVRDQGNSMIAGFIVEGSGKKTILIRGVGPALKRFGLDNAASDVLLSIHDSTGAEVFSNHGWTSGDAAAINNAIRATGAFPLQTGDMDSAVVVTLNPGAYTAMVSTSGPSTSTDGIGLVEVYEVQ